MNSIERLAGSVVARLALSIPDLKAEHFPDAPDRFVWSRAEASLLVSFEGASYGSEQLSMDPPSLERTLDIGVTVITRGLRGKLGMANALEDVRAALFGWTPTERVGGNDMVLGWSRLLPTAERFVGEDQGIWRFLISFRTTTLVVGDASERIRVPFTSLTLLDNPDPCCDCQEEAP